MEKLSFGYIIFYFRYLYKDFENITLHIDINNRVLLDYFVYKYVNVVHASNKEKEDMSRITICSVSVNILFMAPATILPIVVNHFNLCKTRFLSIIELLW